MAAVIFLGSATHLSAKDGSFDKVVLNDEVVEKMTRLGFGATELLNVLEHPAVKAKYDEMRALGAIEVFVQKLPEKNPGEGKTTRFTFLAWKQTDFTSREKVASLQVDQYTDTRMQDASPRYYRVGHIIRTTSL